MRVCVCVFVCLWKGTTQVDERVSLKAINVKMQITIARERPPPPQQAQAK